jgi:RNA polymerase sigma-70 factor, ECF subfamily
VDEQARFERLYRAHAAAVWGYAARRTGSDAVADEIVSDVFLVVWRRLEDVPDRPVPWLLGIARRALANRHRSHRRAAALTDRLAGLRRPASDTSSGTGDWLVDALSMLPAGDRELLMLVAWEGLEVGEIAELLGVRAGTVAVRLHRARRRLAAALSGPESTLTEPREART